MDVGDVVAKKYEVRRVLEGSYRSRAQELAIQGSNDTNDAEARLAIGTQIDQALEELLGIANGLTVVIGAEHADPTLRPFSLVASTYDDGSGIGTIGVIGPTRMRYSRAIALVDATAKAIARVLRHPN